MLPPKPYGARHANNLSMSNPNITGLDHNTSNNSSINAASSFTSGGGGNRSSSHLKYGKVLLFTGGPCTRGAGSVVSIDKSNMMRSHRDIMDGETPLYLTALLFYDKLGHRLARVNVALDVFAQSFDQIGIM